MPPCYLSSSSTPLACYGVQFPYLQLATIHMVLQGYEQVVLPPCNLHG